MSSDLDVTEIYVGSGASDFAQVTLTDKNGNSLASATVQMGSSTYDTPPVGARWSDATIVSAVGPVLTVKFLINSTTCPVALDVESFLWYKLSNGATSVIKRLAPRLLLK